jgi:dihydrodipicolinate synthase/N-acetylneuraminate lyase
MLLQGIFPPITTPFYPDGRVYFKKIEHNVERFSRTPIAGIVILGSTGESVMLSDEERKEVLKAARAATAPNKVLVAGTGMESAIETLKLTDYAAELGYDVALIRTPHFYRQQMQPANLLAFYRFVADRSPLPVMIYNVPPLTAYDMPADVIIELAEHSNIIGIKESSGDIEKIRKIVEATRHIKRSATVTEIFEAVTPRMLQAAKAESNQGEELVSVASLSENSSIGSSLSASPSASSSSAVKVTAGIKTRQKEVGFQLLAGAAQKFDASLQAGAVGGILAFATCAPTDCFEVYAARKEGDSNLATLKQQRIAKAAQRIASELGVPAIKYAMDLNGYYGGPARLPLLPLTAALKLEIEQLMSDIRN